MNEGPTHGSSSRPSVSPAMPPRGGDRDHAAASPRRRRRAYPAVGGGDWHAGAVAALECGRARRGVERLISSPSASDRERQFQLPAPPRSGGRPGGRAAAQGPWMWPRVGRGLAAWCGAGGHVHGRGLLFGETADDAGDEFAKRLKIAACRGPGKLAAGNRGSGRSAAQDRSCFASFRVRLAHAQNMIGDAADGESAERQRYFQERKHEC